ncbi:MAG: hypothetical protein V1703_02450 [Candidatus Altiarchaeota archaeon]
MAIIEIKRTMVDNVFSVLTPDNLKKTFFSMLKIEKNVVLGVAVEIACMAVLMLIAFAFALILTFAWRL